MHAIIKNKTLILSPFPLNRLTPAQTPGIELALQLLTRYGERKPGAGPGLLCGQLDRPVQLTSVTEVSHG